MNDTFYKSIIEDSPMGYAYHKIICDEKGKPCDYEFLEVNSAFKEYTGLKADEVIGKKVTDVIPGIEKDEFDWIGVYGDLALNGGKGEFDQFSEPFNKHYRVKVYSPQKSYFITLFSDITREKEIESFSEEAWKIINKLPKEETSLVMTGIYRIGRNPIVFGVFLCLCFKEY